MATLQRFCVDSRSPTRSPVVHVRRKNTLKMLLSYGGGGGRSDGSSLELRKENGVRNKLKDLFDSSPPAFDERVSENVREDVLSPAGGCVRRGDARSRRQLPAAVFRRRLVIRRAWRPMLVTIPE